jgi:A/G-specific adenine glycosylase
LSRTPSAPSGELPLFPRHLARDLIVWQRHSGRHDLPWQGSRDPYRIWLSEVMLQQTQVAAVKGYYERFLAVFPDVRSLADAPLERVMELWSGLGYYSRARHLHACARQVVSQFDGVFPSDPEVLASLPGIGRSTAAAIAVFSSGARAAILDGNVKRVLCRVLGIEGYPGERSVHERLWRLADALVPEHDREAYTQGLMDWGATVCTPRKPRCDACFARADCVARQTGRVDEIPARKPARKIPERAALMLLLHHSGEILLQRRPAPGIWGGLWCLPEWPVPDAPGAAKGHVGALPPAGDAARACARAFAAERGVVASTAELAPFVHGFTHFRLSVEVLAIDLADRSGSASPTANELWLDLADAKGAALPAPVKRLLEALWRVSPLHREVDPDDPKRLF